MQQTRVIEKMMAVPNQIWDSIIARAAENNSVLQDPEIIKQLGHILKINVRGCSAIGHPFVAQVRQTRLPRVELTSLTHLICHSQQHPLILTVPLPQLGRIYMDMLNLYKCLSENISQAVALSGTYVDVHTHTHTHTHTLLPVALPS